MNHPRQPKKNIVESNTKNDEKKKKERNHEKEDKQTFNT